MAELEDAPAATSGARVVPPPVFATEVSPVFSPGPIGMTINDTTGEVGRLHEGGQAKDSGVQIGWVMRKLDEEPFSYALLKEKAAGTDTYVVCFGVPPRANFTTSKDVEFHWNALGEKVMGPVEGEDVGTAPGNVVLPDPRYTGIVKQFGTGATFTFITSPEIKEVFGKDIFVTLRELEHLMPGQEVSFRVELHKGRPQAFDIEHLDDKDRGAGLQYKKTKLCDFWLKGRCPEGDKCSFAHGDEDLGTDRLPDSIVKQKTKSDKPCHEFQQGVCTRGDDCRFSHVEAEMCADFRLGVCLRDNCRFQHIQAKPPAGGGKVVPPPLARAGRVVAPPPARGGTSG